MKMSIIKKLNILFIVIMLIFGISITTFADDTISSSGIVGIGEKQGDEQVISAKEMTIDNFPELYKMWILELGGERMQIYSKTGEKVYEKVILPEQFKGIF